MSTIGNWLQKNLVGTKGSGYDRTLDQQGEQIKNDINHIKDTVDTLTQPVEVSVEGSYKDLSTKDKLILGAAGGAVVGGGVGAMIGTFEAASDKPQVNVQWQEQHIMDVKVGYEKQNIPGTTEVATMDGLQKVTVDNASIRYHFSPEYTPTDKTYKVPGDITVDHDFTTNSVLGAAKGAAMGAVGGGKTGKASCRCKIW